MKIKIVENPVVTGGSKFSALFRDAIQEIAGEWVDVETTYLFENQYNIQTPSGVNLRVMQHHVEEVENDVRIDKMYCNNCGYHEQVGKDCAKCGESRYLKPFRVEKKLYTSMVNSNWVIFYATQFGSVTPYGKAAFEIVNRKTGNRVYATKWDNWDTLRISENAPQSVRSDLRRICAKHGLSYTRVQVDESFFEE